MIGPVFKSVAKRKGASLRERIDSLGDVLFRGRGAVSDQTSEEKHPVIKARKGWKPIQTDLKPWNLQWLKRFGRRSKR